jgi:NADPH2:quinone reductase
MARMMRAIEVSRPGGPEVLQLVRREVPRPQANEVLIRVHAAGVNGHDLHHRHAGSHPVDPGETDLPGLELAGEVVEIGATVRRWSIGDRVCALVRGGSYAEYCVAAESLCLPIPPSLSMVEASALPEAIFTVWSNVFVTGALKPGERLLVNGGTSGIGAMAIQLAHAFGSQVYATASGAERSARLIELGAVKVFDYRSEDFDTRLASELSPGVDVILELVGGDYLARDVKLLGMDGRLVFVGAAKGTAAEIDFIDILRKRLVLTGSALRPRPLAYKARLSEAIEQRVWPLVAAGAIKPVVHTTVPLGNAANAHRILEARGHLGKVILNTLE